MTIFSFFTPFFIPALFSCLGYSHFQKKKKEKKNATQKGQGKVSLPRREGRRQRPTPREGSARKERTERTKSDDFTPFFLSTKEEGSRAFFDEDEDEEERGR